MQKKNMDGNQGDTSDSCGDEPVLVPQCSAWHAFWAIFDEWQVLSLSQRQNNAFLESFKFSDSGVQFSAKARAQAHMWLSTPGV